MALRYLNETRDRSAEWYYLSAIANSGVGNSLTAINHARQAASQDPGNPEYARLYNILSSGGRIYEQKSAGYGSPCVCPSSPCLWACLAYLCCSGIGGGFGMCHGQPGAQ